MSTTESPENATPKQEADVAATNKANVFKFLRDVEVEVTLEIGRRRMRISDVLKLTEGQTLDLAKTAGEPLDVYINGQLLGRGEAVVVGDRYGVRITEIVTPGDEGDA